MIVEEQVASSEKIILMSLRGHKPWLSLRANEVSEAISDFRLLRRCAPRNDRMSNDALDSGQGKLDL